MPFRHGPDNDGDAPDPFDALLTVSGQGRKHVERLYLEGLRYLRGHAAKGDENKPLELLCKVCVLG